MKKFFVTCLSFALFISTQSLAESLSHLAILIERDNKGEFKEINPVEVKVGFHHYKWSDMQKSSLYNDPFLYQSMADFEFWRNGKSRKGFIEEKTRKITIINNEIHLLTSLDDISNVYDNTCLDKVSWILNETIELLKKHQDSTAVIVFKSKTEKMSYEPKYKRFVVPIALECKSVTESKKSNINDSDRHYQKEGNTPLNKSKKLPSHASKQ
jgi:hypothetical protein